jgi:peroxiredoxin family protein
MEASKEMMEERGAQPSHAQREAATFICARDTLDGVYPPLLLAINARRQGMDAAIFFTFMGLNAIRKGWIKKIKFQVPGFLGAIPGMCSMATGMMKKKIENAGIPEIEDMMDMAKAEGVKFIGCQMTVDMMELCVDDFIEDVEIWTAEDYIKYAKTCKINMFI